MKLYLFVVLSLAVLSTVSSLTVVTVKESTAGPKHHKLATALLTKPERKVVKSPIFHRRPLYYYEQYMEERTKISPTVPLTQHYKNERKLRIDHYDLLDQMQKLKEQLQFNSNDIKHEMLKANNSKVRIEDRGNALEKRIAQRHTACKFQIDHDMAWSTFYQQREKLNQSKLLVALPDEKAGLEKLVQFDKERSAFWMDQAKEMYQTLTQLRSKDSAEVEELTDQVKNLDSNIVKLSMKLNAVNDAAMRKIKNLEEKDNEVLKTLANDEILDKQRIHNEQVEAKASRHGGLAEREFPL